MFDRAPALAVMEYPPGELTWTEAGKRQRPRYAGAARRARGSSPSEEGSPANRPGRRRGEQVGLVGRGSDLDLDRVVLHQLDLRRNRGVGSKTRARGAVGPDVTVLPARIPPQRHLAHAVDGAVGDAPVPRRRAADPARAGVE